jgi:Kef-type K+ transport system membrane component KefB
VVTSSVLPQAALVLAAVAVVLLAAAAMGRLGRRLYQPPAVAEMLTGIVLGPSVLGQLPGDLPGRIFTPATLPLLTGIAQVGLVLFMFLAGWELDLTILRGRKRTVGSLAGLAMAVPFAIGTGTAVFLYGKANAGHVSEGVFVFYMAAAFSITAFPVLARIIRDTRLTRTRVGTVAMTCAAVGDVAAWCVLVLVVAVAVGGGTARFIRVIAMTVAFGAFLGLVARPLLGLWLRRVTVRKAEAGVIPVLIACGALLSAYVTSWIGINIIFGAFAFGLAMPRLQIRELRQQLAAPIENSARLFLPVFFILTGLSTNARTLGWAGLVILLVVIATAVTGKFAGAAIPARLSGMKWRESLAFGALMNARGLTELVVLSIGRDLGVISARLFTIMVLMAVVTTAITGPLLRLLRVIPPEGPAAEDAGPLPAATVPAAPGPAAPPALRPRPDPLGGAW